MSANFSSCVCVYLRKGNAMRINILKSQCQAHLPYLYKLNHGQYYDDLRQKTYYGTIENGIIGQCSGLLAPAHGSVVVGSSKELNETQIGGPHNTVSSTPLELLNLEH